MRVDVDVLVNINNTVPVGLHRAIFEALQIGAEALLTESIKTSPHDEGILDQSGKTSGDFAKMTTAVSYDTPYAVRLHEHPEYNFQGKGRGKWLEKTLQEEKSMLTALIASRIRAHIETGGGI
jgi:hypothetical protein